MSQEGDVVRDVGQESFPAEWFPLTVAIDGPSGSGKSTQARRLAGALGVLYLDTGAMYRAVAWRCLDRGVDLTDDAAVAQVAEQCELTLELDPSRRGVVVDGFEVTDAIREPRISGVVSHIAVNPRCRAALIGRQREVIAQARREAAGIVAEGRDITTVVAPEAEVRILLTADASARVERRASELAGVGQVSDQLLAQTYDQVVGRDETDSAAADFLTPSEGVFSFDSSDSQPENTASVLLSMVRQSLTVRGDL